MKTLIGIVAYGGIGFTKLCVQEIRATTTLPYDLLVVAAKPGDTETLNWLAAEKIPHIAREENMGFCADLNELWDHVWRLDYDNFIIVGNDVIPYRSAIDALIAEAECGEYEWICSSQFDVQSLLNRYPEARRYFTGPNLAFTDFTARPWELHNEFHGPNIEPGARKDVQNLCLYRRSVLEKIGYFDVNFYPNGYFSDNDYCRRGDLANIKACGLSHSAYFHFWSRTIHQGEDRPHSKYFNANAQFYHRKWGGNPGAETFAIPFDGKNADLPCSRNMGSGEVILPADIRIKSRKDEANILKYWREQ